MLPFDVHTARYAALRSYPTSNTMSNYFRRLCDVRQLDFEVAIDQMLSILYFEPQRMYKTFYYRKQTKNQWARDDPAFVVVQIFFLLIASVSYCLACGVESIWVYFWAATFCILIHYLAFGIVMASACSLLCNHYLIPQSPHHSHIVEQEVEWLYSFDVTCNSHFALFLFIYLIQYPFLPLLSSHTLIACVLSNIFFCVSCITYLYMLHLGFRTLPFLGNTQGMFFWYPSCGLVLLTLVSLLLAPIMHFRLNMTNVFLDVITFGTRT